MAKRLTPEEFIKKYLEYALETQRKTGIDARFILAQAALESGWGASAPGNMFFGVKANINKTPENQRQLLTTTEILKTPHAKFPEIISITPREDGKYKYKVKDWFRKYDSPEESFTDHANFFQKNKRYSKALEVRDDPYKFAGEVAKAGYATGDNYAGTLTSMIKTIEKHYDKNKIAQDNKVIEEVSADLTKQLITISQAGGITVEALQKGISNIEPLQNTLLKDKEKISDKRSEQITNKKQIADTIDKRQVSSIENPLELKEIQIEADNLAPKLQDLLQAEADKAQTEMMQRLESASSRISSLLGIPQSKTSAVDLEVGQSLEMEKLKGLQALGMAELYEAKKLEISKKYNNLQIEATCEAAEKGDEEAKGKLPQLESQKQKLSEQKSPIKSVKGMLDKALFDSVASGFKKMGDSAEEAESKTIRVFSAISTNAGKVADFAKGFKSVFGGMDEGLDMVIDSVTNVAQAFATGGPVAGGIALLTEGMKLFNAASVAEKRHQEALKKIHEVTLAQEHAYQLAIRLKSLKYEDGDTVFGSDPYGKAINAAKEYKKNVDILKDSLKGDGEVEQKGGLFGFFKKNKQSDTAALENVQIVTGHKKTGLFGMGKGKDTYSGVLSVYKDLIDSQGKLNIERAKSIVANEKMSDSDKAAFQRMIDNAEAVEQAYGEMKSYLTGIFGQLGNEMTNALVDSFQKGEDAADAFYKSASKMTQQLVKDVINSAVIAPIMQKAQEDAMKIMQDTSLTDEQRMDKLIAITDTVVEQGLAASDRAKKLYDSADQSFENKTGKNFETTDADKFTQSSSKGGFETMSQDQSGELNGRFTALQMSGTAVEEYSNIIAANTGELLNETIKVSMMVEDYLNSFNELRSIQLGSFYELKDINKNTKELYAIREGIEGIKQNTSRL